MTSTSTAVPADTTRSAPSKESGRRRSPSPPSNPVPPSGAFSLSRTKWTLLASSSTFLARASRSGADSSDPPLQATSPGPANRTTASSVTARRGNMSTSRRPAYLPVRRDSSAPQRSAAGARPCLNLRRELRLILEGQVPERRCELRQPRLLRGDHPERPPGADPVIGPEHHLDRVAGPDIARFEDAQVGTRGAVRAEPLHEVGHVPEAGEVGARDPWGGDLEQRRPDPPLLTQQCGG